VCVCVCVCVCKHEFAGISIPRPMYSTLTCDHTLAICRKAIDGHLKEAQELAEARDSALAAHANVQGELQGMGIVYPYAFAFVFVYKDCLHAHVFFSHAENSHDAHKSCIQINPCRHNGA
jgi:hypothetical protein